MGIGYSDLSDDDYRPPTEWYRTPEAKEVLADGYAGKLRGLADKLQDKQNLHGMREYDLHDEAGKTVINAHTHGFLRSIPNLDKYIAWHTASSNDDPVVGKDVQARRARCPYNLFRDIIGGHMAICRARDDGQVELVGPKLDDGILPAIDAAAFTRGDAAEACRFLADTILREVESDSRYSAPIAPQQLVKMFDLSWDTLKKRLDDGQIRNVKLSTKSYRIHRDDLPDGNQ